MNARLPTLRQSLLSAAVLALTACGGEGASLRFSVHESQATAASALVSRARAPRLRPPPSSPATASPSPSRS